MREKKGDLRREGLKFTESITLNFWSDRCGITGILFNLTVLHSTKYKMGS